jgi:hypothetical protein
LNGWLDCLVALSDPSAFDLFYLHKYFHIFIYFFQQGITDFSKQAAPAAATLETPVFHEGVGHSPSGLRGNVGEADSVRFRLACVYKFISL